MSKVNYGGAATGALSGAAAGTAIMPVWGTAIGGVVGGLAGLFSGGKKKTKKKSTLDKNQQALYNKYSEALQGRGEWADMFNFDEKKATDNWKNKYAQPAYERFNQEVIPGITGQFRGQNLQNSSYLGGSLSRAGTDVQRNLDTQLADMLYQGQNQSVERRINGLNNILGMQTFAYQQPQASASDKMFGALTEYGGKATANYIDNKFNGSGGTTPSAAPTAGGSPAPLPGMNTSNPYQNTLNGMNK